MNDALAFIRDTALEAEESCNELYPDFEIYYTKRVDD